MISENEQIDENKIKNILKKVLKDEEENVKTHEYNDDDMVKRIMKIIEEEIDVCC